MGVCVSSGVPPATGADGCPPDRRERKSGARKTAAGRVDEAPAATERAEPARADDLNASSKAHELYHEDSNSFDGPAPDERPRDADRVGDRIAENVAADLRPHMPVPDAPAPANLPRSASELSTDSLTSTFNAADFGTYIRDCDSEALLSDDTDGEGWSSRGLNRGASGFEHVHDGADARQSGYVSDKKDMDNYYNEYVKRNGGGMKTAAQLKRSTYTTVEDLLRLRDGGRRRRSSDNSSDGNSSTGSLLQNSYSSCDGAYDYRGSSQPKKKKSNSRRRKVRDPVDPDLYVQELFTYCREKMRGSKIVIDADGEVRRLYPTQGWHQLKKRCGSLSDSASIGSPFAVKACSREADRKNNAGRSSMAGTVGNSAAADATAQRSAAGASAKERTLSETHEHAHHQHHSRQHSAAPILVRRASLSTSHGPTDGSLSELPSRRDGELVAASEERSRQELFKQRTRVSFADDTKYFHIPRRESDPFGEADLALSDEGSLGSFPASGSLLAQNVQPEQQLALLKGKMARPADA